MRFEEIKLRGMINNLAKIAKDELDLPQLPIINVIVSSDFVPNTTSFGLFDDESGQIYVVAKNRHPNDVMRTLSHELVHYAQSLTGRALNGENGSDDENEANAKGGEIMRVFNQTYPQYLSKDN